MSKGPLIKNVRFKFDYRPEDGALLWRHNRRGGPKAGDVAGCARKAGHVVYVDGFYVCRPRAVWAWHYGRWPTGPIRHVNGNIHVDRIENLIVETNHERAIRTHAGKKRTLPPCVQPLADKYSAVIALNGKNRWLGSFATQLEAYHAVKAAHVEAVGEMSPYFKRGDDK